MPVSIVRDGKNDGIGRLHILQGEQWDTIFLFNFFGISQWIMNFHADTEIHQLTDDIDDARVAVVGHIFFECDAE